MRPIQPAAFHLSTRTAPNARPLSPRSDNSLPRLALDQDDPRWLLARATLGRLQGGQAGILAPADRRGLAVLGSRLGLRPFDTNLVIAIVQDHARCGPDSSPADFLARLRLIPNPAAGVGRPDTAADIWSVLAWLGCTGLLAVGIAAMIRWWLLH